VQGGINDLFRTLKLRAYGRTVGISGPDVVLELARARLPPGYRATTEPAERIWAVRVDEEGGWVALAGDDRLSEPTDEATATEALLSDLELWVAERAQRAVFVHAGCAVVEGSAIVVPGYSHSGKTSLTAALVRAGAEYYSDEFAPLDHRGAVRPYPRSLSVRVEATTPERVPVEEIGGRAGRGPARVDLIAALVYDPNAGFVVERRTDSGAGLLLLQHSVPARARPRATLNAIQHAVSGAVAIVGTRGDADDAAVELLDMLRSVQAPSSQ
jgi:hypothetical protein